MDYIKYYMQKGGIKKRKKQLGKDDAIILASAEPINDGGRKLNVIYAISVIVCFIMLMMAGANVLGIVFSIVLGLVVGWLIKNKITEYLAKSMRNKRFHIDNKIPYSEFIQQLIPILTPLGAMIEKAADENGNPVISFQGAIYDVRYNEDNTFYIWWRQNLVKAFFRVNNINAYRKEVVAMGIVGYHVQQVCKHYNDVAENTIVDENRIFSECEKNFCHICGDAIIQEGKYCVKCGTQF